MTAAPTGGTMTRLWHSQVRHGVPGEVLFVMPSAVSATEPDAVVATLRQIAERIPRLRAQGSRVSEQDTKRILITPAIAALGWDTLDIEEVRNEYRHNTADNPVDYALFLNRSPVLFVEAKPLGHDLNDRKWVVQTINYANAAGVDWTSPYRRVRVRPRRLSRYPYPAAERPSNFDQIRDTAKCV